MSIACNDCTQNQLQKGTTAMTNNPNTNAISPYTGPKFRTILADCPWDVEQKGARLDHAVSVLLQARDLSPHDIGMTGYAQVVIAVQADRV